MINSHMFVHWLVVGQSSRTPKASDLQTATINDVLPYKQYHCYEECEKSKLENVTLVRYETMKELRGAFDKPSVSNDAHFQEAFSHNPVPLEPMDAQNRRIIIEVLDPVPENIDLVMGYISNIRNQNKLVESQPSRLHVPIAIILPSGPVCKQLQAYYFNPEKIDMMANISVGQSVTEFFLSQQPLNEIIRGICAHPVFSQAIRGGLFARAEFVNRWDFRGGLLHHLIVQPYKTDDLIKYVLAFIWNGLPRRTRSEVKWSISRIMAFIHKKNTGDHSPLELVRLPDAYVKEDQQKKYLECFELYIKLAEELNSIIPSVTQPGTTFFPNPGGGSGGQKSPSNNSKPGV